MCIFLCWNTHFTEASKFFLGNTRVCLLSVCPSPPWEGAVLVRMVQDKISISVVAVTGQKYMKVCTSFLTSCHTSGFFFVKSLSSFYSSIWPIDRTLRATTIPSQSGAGSYGNEVWFYYLQWSFVLFCFITYNKVLFLFYYLQ